METGVGFFVFLIMLMKKILKWTLKEVQGQFYYILKEK